MAWAALLICLEAVCVRSVEEVMVCFINAAVTESARIAYATSLVDSASTARHEELLQKKQAGQSIERPERRESARVINLMDALRRSLDESGARCKPAARSVKGRRAQVERPRKRKSRRVLES